MFFRLIERRNALVPTLFGWACLFCAVAGTGLFWWYRGEDFLSVTRREPPDVLVVEGWIGAGGVQAAAAEFRDGGYRIVVAAGGLTGDGWSSRRWSDAVAAREELLRCGVKAEDIVTAPSRVTDAHRTYESALAVRLALKDRGITPRTINVFTEGAHARRSRLVFGKVFGGEARVGVVSWTPAGYLSVPWWHSSPRADDFLKETVGYAYEAILNSGREAGTNR
jgi:uncharacterized SAM-binding protein YcdF (DUF218 family)